MGNNDFKLCHNLMLLKGRFALLLFFAIMMVLSSHVYLTKPGFHIIISRVAHGLGIDNDWGDSFPDNQSTDEEVELGHDSFLFLDSSPSQKKLFQKSQIQFFHQDTMYPNFYLEITKPPNIILV